MPGPEACQQILMTTLGALAAKFPKLEKLLDDQRIKDLGKKCVGLDGRRIRKAAVSALACSKETAIDPSKLTADHVIEAVEQARKQIGVKK